MSRFPLDALTDDTLAQNHRVVDANLIPTASSL